MDFKMFSKSTKISSVPDFYKGTDILITGATGFLGYVLIEKLLRSCSDLNKIYAIVRPKRGISIQERKKAFMKSELFEELISENPTVFDKLEFIEGDISLLELGLSLIDRKKLENVSIVFHSAASVRFDEPLKDAILGHVRGTRDILELSTTFKKLKAFVYVSTAFCNMDNGNLEEMKEYQIKEKVYPEVDDWKNVIKLAENLDGDVLDCVTSHFTKFSVNTYLYTKAVAENVCKSYEQKVPLVIFRPTIVIAKAIPPFEGWINNLNGPYGVSIGGLLGVLRICYGKEDSALDVIPVDVTVNGMILSACKRHIVDESTAVYNANFLKTSIGQIDRSGKAVEFEFPLSKTIWTKNVTCTTCKYNFIIQSILFHFIPAALIDGLLKFMDKKPQLLKVHRKVQAAQKALALFMKTSFEIFNYNFTHLDCYLNEEDRKTFDIKITEVAKYHDRFNKNTIKCIRKYILKDPDETIPAARKRLGRLKLADNVVRAIFWSTIAYYLYSFVLSVLIAKRFIICFSLLRIGTLKFITMSSSKLTHIPSVADFYKGCEILITGATGFIGLVLVEKLLRSCPELTKIYAIVRPKKGKSVQERKSVFTECEIYFDLIKNNPNALDKLELIEGDMSLPGLGISKSDRKRLENVSIVFHSAASIRFDDPLKDAVLGHVRATRDLLELAMTFKKMKAFVHVSTAYCNMDNGSLYEIKERRIEERFYPNVDDWRNIIKLAENVDRETLDILSKYLTKFSLNTYLYTKALAENVCHDYEKKLPIVIYRPSIVIQKATEPCMGWISTLNGPSSLSIAGFLGLLRCVYGTWENKLDGVFVDAAVNGMIISACKRHLIDDETPVYNSTVMSSSGADVIILQQDLERDLAMSMAIWTCNISYTKCEYNFKFQSVLSHLLPAIIIDTVLKLRGQEPRLQKIQRKIHRAQIALKYFSSNSFQIRNFKYLQLEKILNASDKITFDPINKEVVRRNVEFVKKSGLYTRRHFLKDPDETIPAARKRLNRIKFADKMIRLIVLGSFVYKIYDYFLF
uniref:Fatty acyl-CoA reductase n=1 Tax=Culicoides sonorensis TaxID=179676 RepID=A0A336M984_CULSO